MAAAGRINAAYLHEVAHDERACVREDLAVQLAQFLDGEGVKQADREAVEPALAVLADDPVLSVRRALAGIIAASPNAPREILRILVCDIDDISLPILENTPAMPEADLASVVKAGPLSRQMAIVRRREISSRLARIIIDICCEDVCVELLRNGGAQIDGAGYERLVGRHGDHEAVRQVLAERGALPVRIAAMMAAKMPAEAVRDGAAIAEDRNETILKLIRASTAHDLRDLAMEFCDSEVLTASLILRAAFIGRMEFVVEALSVLSGVPARHVRSLLLGRGRLGARAIYLRAGLPAGAFLALRIALDVYAEAGPRDAISGEVRFGRRLIERVATDHVGITPEERRYLLGMMASLGPRGARGLAAQLVSRLAEAA